MTCPVEVRPAPGELHINQVTGGAGGFAFLSTDHVPIRGVVIKALAANTGIVWLVDANGNAASGYPLAAGETISIGTDDLNKIRLYFPTITDRVAYVAILA